MRRALVALLLLSPTRAFAEPNREYERLSIAGLRGTSERIADDDAADVEHALLLASRSIGYASDDWLSVQREQFAAIGGGSAGFEAELGSVVRGGARVPVGETHGPIARGGLELYVGGNDRRYHSLLELPHVQVGWQWLDRDVLVEIGAQGGLILLGELQSDLGERSLEPALAWGGALALELPPVRADLWLRRIEAPDEGPASGAVDAAGAQLCGYAWRVGACSEARLLRGELARLDGAGTTELASVQVQLTLGVRALSF